MGGELTTLCTCWKAQLKNGQLLGFTDHSRDIAIVEPVSFGSTTMRPEPTIYRASSGFTPSAVENSAVLNVDNLELEALLTNDQIQESDLMAGRWDAAAIEIFMVNYENLTMGRLILKSGILGQITVKKSSFMAEIRGLTQAYTTQIGESYTPHCRAKLGDARCKVNVAAFTFTGTVQGTSTSNSSIFDNGRTEAGPSKGVAVTNVSRAQRAVVSAGGHTFGPGDTVYLSDIQGVVQAGSLDSTGAPQVGSYATLNGRSYAIADVVAGVSFSIPVDTRLANANSTLGPTAVLQYSAYISGGVATLASDSGYFEFGTVIFTTGKNAGLGGEVKLSSPGRLELQLPMPFPITIGDTYKAVAGCSGRLLNDCKTKFNNVINFRGEPYIPGLDKMMIVGTGADSAGITYTNPAPSGLA